MGERISSRQVTELNHFCCNFPKAPGSCNAGFDRERRTYGYAQGSYRLRNPVNNTHIH